MQFTTAESAFLFDLGKLLLPAAVEKALCVGGVLWIEKDWREKKELLFDAIEAERCDGCCDDGDWRDAQRKTQELVENVRRRLLRAEDTVQGIQFV